jgi:hypothetical protein
VGFLVLRRIIVNESDGLMEKGIVRALVQAGAKKGGRLLDVLIRDVAIDELVVNFQEFRSQGDALFEVLKGWRELVLHFAGQAQSVMIVDVSGMFLDQTLYAPGDSENGGGSG